MTENYQKYISYLNGKISNFFEQQKDYIKCSKGCAKCCKNGEYPFSEAEFRYLLQGFVELDKKTQDIIEKNIVNVIEEKKKKNSEKFIYDCPFLVDNLCSVYDYRGIICRTFGLIENEEDDNIKVPFCSNEGLNYSNVLDKETNQLSTEIFEKSGLKTEPLGFNINYDFLTSEKFEKQFNINFGDKKPLIDWFETEK